MSRAVDDTRPQPQPILVWDLPVRVFHWLMAGCFVVAWLSSESERWRLLHITVGYTMGGLVAFRLLWGVVGTSHARFADFVRGPRAVWGYLGALTRGHPAASVGHNPAGGWAILVLLGLTALTAASGWAVEQDWAGSWIEESHEVLAYALLSMIGVHLAGVAVSSWLHRENLVRAMLTGRKIGLPMQSIRSSWRWVAALVLAAVVGYWVLQIAHAPAGPLSQAMSESGDDDD
jgi:cytochrome b